MKFSEVLKQEADPILQAIFEDPFVKGIGNGHVPRKALTFYVGQDFNYLNAFMKVYAAAIQKCEKRQDIKLFHDQIGFILDDEIHPHHVFCNIAGVEYATLQSENQAPTTYLYNEHMYNAVRNGQLIDIVAAMLPCPWTYTEIGNRLVKLGSNSKENPFTDWINFYADNGNPEEGITEKLFILLDRESEKYDSNYLENVKKRFLKSCELELMFWQQAYQQKDWVFN